MTAEQEAKLYAAVLYAITDYYGGELDVVERSLLADRILREIIDRKLAG